MPEDEVEENVTDEVGDEVPYHRGNQEEENELQILYKYFPDDSSEEARYLGPPVHPPGPWFPGHADHGLPLPQHGPGAVEDDGSGDPGMHVPPAPGVPRHGEVRNEEDLHCKG